MDNTKSRLDSQSGRPRLMGDIVTGGSNPGRKRSSMRKKRLLVSLVFTLVAAVIVASLFYFVPKLGNSIDSSKYQAVFLSNGQVYFGKLKSSVGEYVKLSDVFYIQTDSEQTNQSAGSDANLQLIKLGSEVHGPEDEMIINKDQVLFFENIKSDGKVSDSITKYYEQNKK